MTDRLDPALAVLLAACDPDGGERLRRAALGVRDWQAVLVAADRHNMTGVLAARLPAAAADVVPPAVLDQLRGAARDLKHDSLRMGVRLLRLLSALDAAGVRAVPFKGAVLSRQAYGDPGLRRFGDLDLLMSSADALRARAVLAEAGYRGFQAPYGGPDDAVLLRLGMELVLRRSDGLMVELHDRVLTMRGASSGVCAGDLVARAGEVELFGSRAPALCDEDVVLVQAIHGARHGWDCVEHVACLVSPIRRVTARGSWPAVLERAAAAGALRRLAVGVLLVSVVLDEEPPHEVLEAAARVPAVWPLVEDALEALVLAGTARPRTRQGDAAWLARYEDGPAAAVRLLVNRAIQPGPEEWSRLRLPPRAFPLYWVWRPVRLAGKHLGATRGSRGAARRAPGHAPARSTPTPTAPG